MLVNDINCRVASGMKNIVCDVLSLTLIQMRMFDVFVNEFRLSDVDNIRS